MWTILLYTICKLKEKKDVMTVGDVVKIVYDKLWLTHRISFYEEKKLIYDILRNMENSGIISMKCDSNKIDDCEINVTDSKCKSFIEEIEKKYLNESTLLGEAYRIIRKEIETI